MKASEIKPKISIGLTVYNGAKTIEKCINSLLLQTFQDFELIISDNNSDDDSGKICKEFSLKDSRIKYIRQKNNTGGGPNHKFVLEQASGKYFMFIGHDDWISSKFLEVNLSFLESNLNFVSSTSPNCFDGEENNPNKYVDFNLKGALKVRQAKFLQNAWISHGIFYSLMRTEIIKEVKDIANIYYIGADWSVNFFLLSKGEVNRSKEGLLVLGKFGGSMDKNPYKKFRVKPIEIFIPLYMFSKIALGLMKNLKHYDWLYVFIKLLKVNLQAMRDSYKKTIREFIK